MSTAKIALTAEQKELLKKMPKGGYPPHPFAEYFPRMTDDEFKQHEDSVGNVGVRIPVVLLNLPGKEDLGVLDGRHRQDAAIKHDQDIRFRMYDPKIDGESPLGFVTDLNLNTRHMTLGQRAALGVKLKPLWAQEAELLRGTIVPQETDSKNGSEPPKDSVVDATGEFAQAPEKKKPATGKTSKKLAKAVGVSAKSIERAEKLKKDDPKAFEEVAAGTRSLNAAVTGKPTKGSLAEQAYNDALERIGKVCGAPQVKAIKQGALLTNRKDVLLYAEQTDEKMLAIRAFVDQGWAVKKALNFKAEDLNQTHRIVDLAWRTQAAGGKYKQDVLIENSGIIARITCEVVVGDEVTKMRHAKKATKKKK